MTGITMTAIAQRGKTETEAFEMSGKCPFGGDRIGGAFGMRPTLSDWYPNRLKVELLHHNGTGANPLSGTFDYAEAFDKIDFAALKRDIKAFLTTSVPWWPSVEPEGGRILRWHGDARQTLARAQWRR